MSQGLYYITTTRLPTEKAYGVQITEMCSAFAKLGWDVTLVHPYRKQPHGRTQTEDIFSFYSQRPTFKVLTIPSYDFQGQLDMLPTLCAAPLYLLRWIFWSFRLPRALSVRTSDLCVTRDITVSFALSHHRISHILELHQMPSGLQKLLLRHLLSHCITNQRLRGLVALTHHLGDQLRRMGAPDDRVLVAHDAVDLTRFEGLASQDEQSPPMPFHSSSGPTVGYIGRFRVGDSEKGLPELFRAFRLVLDRIPEANLLCVGGPDSLVSHYLALASESGIPPGRVRIIGHRPFAEVPAWIGACDVVTIPWNYSEFSAHYTSPMKLFEYLAAGVPIVSSRLPSLCEILSEDTAFFFTPGDVAEFAQMLLRALELSVEARASRANLSRALVASHTWDQRAARILHWAVK